MDRINKKILNKRDQKKLNMKNMGPKSREILKTEPIDNDFLRLEKTLELGFDHYIQMIRDLKEKVKILETENREFRSKMRKP